jgi:hypothetical protein
MRLKANSPRGLNPTTPCADYAQLLKTLCIAVTAHFATATSWTTRSVLLALAAFVALRFQIDVLWAVLVGAGIGIFFL